MPKQTSERDRAIEVQGHRETELRPGSAWPGAQRLPAPSPQRHTLASGGCQSGLVLGDVCSGGPSDRPLWPGCCGRPREGPSSAVKSPVRPPARPFVFCVCRPPGLRASMLGSWAMGGRLRPVIGEPARGHRPCGHRWPSGNWALTGPLALISSITNKPAPWPWATPACYCGAARRGQPRRRLVAPQPDVAPFSQPAGRGAARRRPAETPAPDQWGLERRPAKCSCSGAFP